MAEIAVTDSQNGETIAVSLGDVIAVRLPENATTGYRWQVDSAGSLQPAGDELNVAVAPGAGGERIFRFAAVAPGATPIELSLRRAWEASAQKHFTLALVIA